MSRSGMSGAVLAMILALGAAAPASALTLSKREMTCPLDGQKFTATVIGSYTQFGIRLDLKPHGALMAPAPIPVCPASGFPIYRENFTADEIARLKALVETAEYKALRARHTDYFMWSWIERHLGGADPWRHGNILLRATWQAEAGDAARLAEYRALARDQYDAAAKAQPAGSANALTAALMAAEMDRLLGRFAEAQARLDALATTAWPENSVLGHVHAQIARWVAARDSLPQNFVLPPKKS